jgi:hypothetical protein
MKNQNHETHNREKQGDARRLQDLMTKKLKEYDDIIRGLNK